MTAIIFQNQPPMACVMSLCMVIHYTVGTVNRQKTAANDRCEAHQMDQSDLNGRCKMEN